MKIELNPEIIKEKSFKIASKYVRGNSKEDYVKKYVIIATGNPKASKLLVFKNNPIDVFINAIENDVKIVCDVKMLEVSIKYKNVEHVVENHTNDKYSKAYLSFKKNADLLDKKIIAIGNSPTAAYAVYELLRENVIEPYLVIATPVGFVNAAISKALIRSIDIPSITTRGSFGGSSVAVAIINAILDIYVQNKRRS